MAELAEWISIHKGRTMPIGSAEENMKVIRAGSPGTFSIILDIDGLFIWSWNTRVKAIIYVRKDLIDG